VIPRANITAWRRQAPWSTDAQVEQDLVLSRAIVEIYSNPILSAQLAFRGGTALHKLHLSPALRYSEDIDLVQVQAGPIGPVMTALHATLDPWLGEPRRKQSEGRMTFIYRFDSEIQPVTPLRVKVEVNTREHFTVFGFVRKEVAVDNPWFTGEAEVVTYALEELLGTKLRAFYQRKKGRDLFDLAVSLARHPELDAGKTVDCFQRYMANMGTTVSRAGFEANLAEKVDDPTFHSDIAPLLARADEGKLPFDVSAAAAAVMTRFIVRLPGEPWRGRHE
jgi:predicted nucleotidyltransferase component of viral defense system